MTPESAVSVANCTNRPGAKCMYVNDSHNLAFLGYMFGRVIYNFNWLLFYFISCTYFRLLLTKTLLESGGE